jgi:dipeptidyl aminopeptidase/acylaminoacyl peptidase
MGLSYGGYLAAQAAVRQPRFRAAVVMSGVTDWLGFATTSAIGGGYDAAYHPLGDLGSAAGRETLVAPSPLYAADSDATPTLFLHGALDRITPLAQAEQLFGRLTRAGVETELVVYPREGHELVEPAHRRDAAARVSRWLRDHGVLDETED